MNGNPTDPEVAWVGLTETEAKAQGIEVKKGLFPRTASGRAIANGRDEGVTKLLFGDSPEAGSGEGHSGRGQGKILGGGMVGTHAGVMVGEIALEIEMGADAVDIGMAAEIAHGSCTNVQHARIFVQILQCLPCMDLSRTGHTGQSICTTSIKPNHSVKGSMLGTAPSCG